MVWEYDSCSQSYRRSSPRLTRRLVTKMDNENVRVNAYYVRGPSRTVHTIPFSRKVVVDKILNSPEPFGPDSQNITDINIVIFYGKFDGERGIQTMRCGDYTYEQSLRSG